MTKIISFSGISNSGKTTLITGLCTILVPRFKVGIIKHDPKNKAVFEPSSKDSFKFFESGADVAIISPQKTSIRQHKMLKIEEVLEIMNSDTALDYLFIEGFKKEPYKRICVIRDEFEDTEVKYSNAIATLFEHKDEFSYIFKDKTILDLNNHYEVLSWIDLQS